MLMISNDTACVTCWSWLFERLQAMHVVDTTTLVEWEDAFDGMRSIQPSCWLYVNDHDDDDVLVSSSRPIIALHLFVLSLFASRCLDVEDDACSKFFY